MNYPINNITEQFEQLYFPTQALIFYRHAVNKQEVYIEKFNCNRKGRLVNAHPLSEREIMQLGELFKKQHKQKDQFLECEGLLQDNLLYLNKTKKCAIWYSPAQFCNLYFTQSLQLANGKMPLPGLIWKATDTELYVFATTATGRPTVATELFHAPFFNLHDNGRVCMGTVEVDMTACKSIEAFVSAWENYFFNSKFSHLIGEEHPTRTLLHSLYQRLLDKQIPFPQIELRRTGKILQQIIP